MEENKRARNVREETRDKKMKRKKERKGKSA